MKRILFSLLVLAFVSTYAIAQTTACPCCEESHKQFDFWEGHWVVKDTTGTILGENHITKIEGNCVLKEQWIGASGTTGISLNYFDKSDRSWNQLWLDNGGNQLKLKGNFNEGKMVLRSEMVNTQDSEYYNQITWSKNQDGSVTQLWQVFDASNKPLRTLFKGIYHKKSKSP